ncbi:DsrE family protein [Thiohalobacter sp. IOR34]|uniref:DsrE family protein n=1 Tax=Thiohalobacter sp. IOR34 TaxID=3057176 RepID=UPI0025B1C647|nr:DsrE family protein [Thiohalobacter sp. IOR34]WJW76765.1 DsrE family protein [Thiohalobacter sp. IOR34]
MPLRRAAVPLLCLLLAALPQAPAAEAEGARFVQTPYVPQQVLFEFYFDTPDEINAALYWIRSLINPLMESPYDIAPEMLDIKVVVHGTEIVALAKKNEARYRTAVQRMRYYSQLGVEFRVCALAAADFGYQREDFQDFVLLVPSAMTDLAHWQQQGYALITPRILEKRYRLEEIR